MNKKSPVFQNVKALTVAAMLTAISVVIGIFCKSLLNFGGGLFRITFENLPIILSGFLFGPIVGGMVGVATDVLSYLLSGQAYPLNLIVTVGAGLIGVISGLLFRLPIKGRTLRVILSTAVAHAVGSMTVKTVGLYQFYGILVLWRIPLYVVIAGIETALICVLLRRKSIQRLFDGL
jgi:ECF transporter S component (folate family)